MIFAIFLNELNCLVYVTIGFLLPLVFFSGHPQLRVMLYSLPFLLIFISSASSLILFGKGSTVWFHWGLVNITAEGFEVGLIVGFRALIFGILGLLFALTTRPIFLFYSLMQQLKLKPKYAYSFMAAIRLFPLMIEEFQTLRYALKVRGTPKRRGIAGFYHKLKLYSIPLLAQSIRRAQRIAVAMEAKRFSMVKSRTYYYQMGYSRFDLWFLCYIMAVIVLAFLAAEHYPLFTA